MNELVSVVVPFRDAAGTLPRLFAALDAQRLPADAFEVILVDDASKDEGPALASAWTARSPRRRRLVRGTGAGPASARNAGIALARGDWIAFTDGDVVPDERWLEALVAARDTAGAIEGSVLPEGNGVRGNAHYVANERGGIYITANMAYRRDVLERAGGFDERFRAPFLEDSDLAFRVLDMGVDIPFVPAVLVRHPVVAVGPLAALRGARKLRWLPLLARKHPARYATDIRPLLPPLTRPDLHILAGLGGLALLGFGGAPRLAGALLAANAARVGARDPRLRVPARQVPAQAAVVAALPLVKATSWLEGRARNRNVR